MSFFGLNKRKFTNKELKQMAEYVAKELINEL